MAGGEDEGGSEERSGDINGSASSDDEAFRAKRKSRGKHKKKHKSKSKKRKKRRHKSRSPSPTVSLRSRSRSRSRSKSRSRSASPKPHRLETLVDEEEGEKSNLFRLEKSSGEENGNNLGSLKQTFKQENIEWRGESQEKDRQSKLPEEDAKGRSTGKERKKQRSSSKELSDTSVQKEEKQESSPGNASVKKRRSPHKKPRSLSRSRTRRSRSTSHSKHKRSRSRSYSRHRKSRSRSRKRSTSRSRRHGHLSSPRRRSCSRDRRHSRSPKRSQTRRSRSRSRRRSNSRTRRHSCSHRTRQLYSSRSRYRESRSRSRHRSQSWSRSRRRSRSPLYSHRRDRPRSRSQERKRYRSRSRSKSQDKKDTKNTPVSIPVATTNVTTVDKPSGSETPSVGRVSGSKSIAELTAFCKKLTEEKSQDNGGVSDNSNEKEEDSLQPAHHPFLVKPAADIYIPPILFPPIKPVKLQDASKPLPEQFPVSCGSKHREKEMGDVSAAMVENMDGLAPPQDAGVFTKAPVEKIDISALVVKRMDAQRRLTVNPEDLDAQLTLQEIEMKLQNWCQSNVKPGQFTGQLVKSLLPSRELQGGLHAWARKDMFQNLSPLSGGVGMMLMQKMGWQPGQVLGKRGDGYAEPIAVQVKIDRKGLSSTLEKAATKKTSVLDVQGKHPVSALSEYCSKRRWPLPEFKLAFDHGAPHSRQFLFKVVVNDMEYQPAIVSGNKKQAKAEAAVYALKALGLMPENAKPQY